MGIINHGILGGIKGSVSNVSGRKSKGRNVLTIKPDMSNVVKSSIQVVNNDKFNVLRKLYLNSNETINKITCANNPFKEAGYNFFSRKNYDNLTFDNIVSVNNIFIGNSGLPRVQILSAKYNSAHTSMTVTYSTSTFNVYGASSKTYCCLYDATNIILYCLPTNYNFFSGTFVIDLPVNHNFDFNNLYVSVIASSNTDSKKFSNTLNNWILSTTAISTFNWLNSYFSISKNDIPVMLSEGIYYEGGAFNSPMLSSVNNILNQTLEDHSMFCFPFEISPFSLTSGTFKALVNGSTKICQVDFTPFQLFYPKVINQQYLSRLYSYDNQNYARLYYMAGLSNYVSPITLLSELPYWINGRLLGTNPTLNVTLNNTGRPRFCKLLFKCSNDMNTYALYIYQRAQ